MDNHPIVRMFNHNGAMFAIPFQFIEIDAKQVLVAFAQDIGKVFYDTIDEKEAANNINRVASSHPGLFENKGLRTATFRVAVDGKRRKAWAYTKQGVMALGMKVRSDIGAVFVLWASEIMTALLEGETVSLQEPEPQSAFDLIIQQALAGKKVVEEQERQRIEQEKQRKDLDDLHADLKAISERTLHETKRPDEFSCRYVAEILEWYSKSGRFHNGAISSIAKDRGYVRRGLARMAESWVGNGSGRWVPVLVFTKEGVETFAREIDQAYKGIQRFDVPLKGNNAAHVWRYNQKAEKAA